MELKSKLGITYKKLWFLIYYIGKSKKMKTWTYINVSAVHYLVVKQYTVQLSIKVTRNISLVSTNNWDTACIMARCSEAGQTGEHERSDII